MVGDNSLVSIPLNCVSSLLSGKCRICHASTGMTLRGRVQARGHIVQTDSGCDHNGHPYCIFSYPCAVCGEDVEVMFTNSPGFCGIFTDRYESTPISRLT